ncbi:MAG: hypothetical protein ACJ8C4_05900 [Gemmataceae bacterium]
MSQVTPPVAHRAHTTPTNEIRVYGHSKLFYWWPIWMLAFLFAILTWWDGHRMAILPPGTRVEHQADRPYVITAEPKPNDTKELDEAVQRGNFRMRVSQNHSLGAIFVIALLLVVTITNVPMRGLWSVILIVILVLGTIIISLVEGLWDRIFSALGDLHIHINLAGYLFIGLGLLALWGFTVFFFDRQIYMVFTPGQLRVCLEIGAGETAYDTMGMVIQRQRDDLFRHWILGLGSGDLIVRTSGAHSHEFHMENVLNVSSKLHAIEDMMRDKQVVAG